MRGLRYCILMTGILSSHVALAQGAAIDPPCLPIDRAGYVIDKPGRYCVVKDLHTRLDFADHSVERALIEIKSSDVVLDLQGHRLDKGWRWLSTQPSSNGIIISGSSYFVANRLIFDDRMENITILNGYISDAIKGIFFYRTHKRVNTPVLPRVLLMISSMNYKYETSNIVIKDIVFERCKENFSFNDWAASREIYLREKDATQETFSPK